jgi:excisionase family DNA binding protein
MDQLLTPRQVAELLQITPRTVCRYAAEGRLQRVKIGTRLTRYTVDSVAQLITPQNDQEPLDKAAPGKAARGTAPHTE